MVLNKNAQPVPRLGVFVSGGPERSRTAYLVNANDALCQMSYRPKNRRLKSGLNMEEREGFEPSIPFGMLDFESSDFNRSSTSPLKVVLPQQDGSLP